MPIMFNPYLFYLLSIFVPEFPEKKNWNFTAYLTLYMYCSV